MIARTSEKLRWLLTHPEFRRSPARLLGRVALWEYRRLRGVPVELALGKYMVRARPTDGIGRLICYFGLRADELFAFLPWFLRPGMTMVDVGANIGTHSIVAAKLVGDTGRVFAYEPDPNTFRMLRHNLVQNHATNVVAREVCVGTEAGVARFNVNADSAKSSIVRPGIRQIDVQVVSLDACEHGERTIDLLKIDVEGADLDVLVGAERILATRPPRSIVIETTDARSAIYELLERNEYRLFGFDPDGLVLRDKDGDLFNCYAVHSSVPLTRAPQGGWQLA